MAKTHLSDYLQFHAAVNGNKPALVFESTILSWFELWKKVEIASGFISDNLGTGNQKIVSLLLTNSPEFVIAYLAIVHSGHIAMPLDPAYKKLELDAIVRQVPPVLLITDKRYHTQVSARQAKVVMIDTILKHLAPPKDLLRLPPSQQIASLTFTSGTTGVPKAAPYTHANHLWNIKVCSKVWDWTSKDTPLILLPLSHWYGLVMGLSGALYHGNTLYLRQQSLDADAILADLTSGKISIFTHTPFAYIKMLGSKKSNHDLSKVRLLISGGGPLPPLVWQQFKKRYGVDIIETYGSSETGRIAANPLTGPKAGSPGKLLPDVQLRIGADSEILIKSPGVFPGYYKNATALRSKDKNDWWQTGDAGELRGGYLYLKGRVGEHIRKFGYSISPRDVEWALLRNPKIKEVQVIAKQIAGQSNDELVYFIVGKLSQAELTDYSKQNLLFAWRPDRVVFLDSLPRTASGKPSLAKMRRML